VGCVPFSSKGPLPESSKVSDTGTTGPEGLLTGFHSQIPSHYTNVSNGVCSLDNLTLSSCRILIHP